jgi:hypothetical protein
VRVFRPKTVTHAVESSQIRRSLRRRQNIINRDAVFECGSSTSTISAPSFR